MPKNGHWMIVILMSILFVTVVKLAQPLEARLTRAYNERASQPSMSAPRLIKLPRNGPKPGQSTAAWLYGKDKNCQAERDAAQWTKTGDKAPIT